MIQKSTKFIFVIILLLILITLVWLVSKSPVTVPQDEEGQEYEKNRAFLGNEKANIVITEYADFACPLCREISFEVKKMYQIFGNKVKVEFRHLPLTNETFRAAMAVECAQQQGEFWSYFDLLFSQPQNFSEAALKRYAQELKLNQEGFNQCLDQAETANIVSYDLAQAAQQGVTFAPTILLNGRNLGSDWRSLEQQILHLIALEN